jgi:hypothetical protein
VATFNEKRRGWQWLPPERPQRQQALRKIQTEFRRHQEQVRRIKAHELPFLAQAEEAVRHLKTGLGAAATLDLSNRGPKYLPVSPEELDRILASVPQLLEPWRRLASSPAFCDAVRQKNREARAHNARVREHNRAVVAQEAALWAQASSILVRLDQGDIDGAVEEAARKGLP